MSDRFGGAMALLALVLLTGCQVRRDFRAREVLVVGSRLDAVESEAPLFRAGSRVRLAWSDAPGAPELTATVGPEGGVRFAPVQLLRLGVRHHEPSERFLILSGQRPPLAVPFSHDAQVSALVRWGRRYPAEFAAWRQSVAEAESPWEVAFEDAEDVLEDEGG